MKKFALLLAVAALGLVLSSPAQAQYYPAYPSYSAYPSTGVSVGVYTPGFGGNFQYGSGYNGGYGYNSGYGGQVAPVYGYQRGHYDYQPATLVPHGGHYHYVPPHVDYHIGRRSYEVIPTPYGSRLSPAPHRH